MDAPVPDRAGAAPRVALFLPVAFLLHLAEEWFGGFSAWTRTALGVEVGPERFLLINAVAFLLFSLGTVAALRLPRMAWFAVTFAALLGLNGVLHTLATLGLGAYSPGTVTGLLLYLPLSVLVLQSASARLSRTVLTRAIIVGVLLHGLVALAAFVGGD